MNEDIGDICVCMCKNRCGRVLRERIPICQGMERMGTGKGEKNEGTRRKDDDAVLGGAVGYGVKSAVTRVLPN